MAAQWYAVLVGLTVFLLGILLFGTYVIEGAAYAWLFLIIGLLGLVIGFSSEKK